MKIYLLFLCALTIVLMIILNSCAGITYQGKYGTYTATPAGQVIIQPKYAITDAKGH